MHRSVREVIVAAIGDHGPISFAEYMDLALYGPGGYYEEPPVGAHGDFVTSPHIHPVFGELLGRAIAELRVALGMPDPFRLVEIGAGDGTLAAQLIRELQGVGLDYVAVERSRGARRALAAIPGIDVRDTFGPALDATPQVVLAHELLDNLPFRRARGTRDGTREVRVGSIGDRLVEVLGVPDDDLARAVGDLEPGVESVYPDGALDFIDRLAITMGRGYALLIDYGHIGSGGGPTHGYRDHRVIGDPLDSPGRTDITAGVDLGLVTERATRAGLIAFPIVTQHEALMALGFDAWIRSELARQIERLDERDGLGAVRAWSGRSRATLLADPASLGRFRWLLLSTLGLPCPRWLEIASERITRSADAPRA